MYAEKPFENKIFWKRIIKKPLKSLTWFFPLHPISFCGEDYEKQKGTGTSYHSLIGLQNMFRKLPLLVLCHLGIFDDLMQSGFWFIPKITFANLCKLDFNVVIIPVSSDPLNLETVESKEKALKNEYFENVKRFFDEIKSIFVVFEMLSFGKI